MGVSILSSQYGVRSTLYDDTTDWSFGPVATICDECGMDAEEQLEEFLSWLDRKNDVSDPRLVNHNDLSRLWAEFRDLHAEHICFDCEGTGRVPHGPNEVTCSACNGAGRLGGKTVEDAAIESATGETIR